MGPPATQLPAAPRASFSRVKHVGRVEGATKKYYHKDHLGSTRAVTNSSGTVIEARDYYPFGLVMPGRSYVSGTPAKEGFTGKERDAETGLDYFGARYYDSAIGRWMSVDPLTDDPMQRDQSPYQYAWNNPTNVTDPDGRCPSCLFGAFAGAVTDAGLQVAFGVFVDGKDFSQAVADIDYASVLVAASAGAVSSGVSILSKARQFGKLTTAVTEVAIDASASVTNQFATEGSVDGLDVGVDVVLGQSVGKVVGRTAQYRFTNSSTGKKLARDANRAKRIARNRGTTRRQAAREEQAQAAQRELDSHTVGRAAGTGTAAAGAGSDLIHTTVVHRDDDDEQE